mmetsp:Transcript_729/g.1301  ORF Transcript_729/g.1301 Transcript_729/m.1301 type:complete len:485 (-) Transcript_729:688-2142(-)|eukprot:CAMPEP_0197536276 /NCGR_PEP_ID=MMETSP1318-20131121/53444_1 /TAXON_ID=552666 /ORGANISM="Partenskyella glossopodia, Strain RCC365" /LENGTH=484 /DNA_ID=CAMNT_0043094125 /DNA_START=29 /DNA_END=1483 /DNA_ORIENTATION=-
MPSSRRTSRASSKSRGSTPARKRGASKKSPARKTPKSSKKSKVAKKKTPKSSKKKIVPAYDEDEMRELDAVIKKLAAKSKVKIFEVTADNAEDIHAELRKGGHARLLTQGKVRTEFMYNYFSCKHGSYLPGSSKLDGSIPNDKEYSKSFSSSNFWWNGLRIFALRSKTGTKSLCGFVVMHNAYLSMYPGSDEDHYTVDPVMKAGRKNITKEIGNERLGSDTWADVPILCGSGHGDLLIALALAKCGMKKIIVSVATGEENEAMQHLLERWRFDKLDMTHPKTKEPWEDEDGDESFVMYRDESVTADEIVEHSKEEKTKPKPKPAPKKKKEKKSKSSSSESKKASDKTSGSLSKKIKDLKDKSKEKVEKIKAKHESVLAAKEKALAELKSKLKAKDAEISALKAKAKDMSKSQKAHKARIINLVKEAYDSVIEEEKGKSSSSSKVVSKKKPSKKPAKKKPAPKKATPSRKRKSSSTPRSSKRRRR